jgi:formyl-CoA transferase
MKAGDVFGEELLANGKPLDGVRVLAIEQMQALPFATQLLGHMGAEVVKVEHPRTGDSGRGSKPAVHDIDGEEVGATYLRNNLGKKSIAVALKHPDGIALIKKLVPRFDVVGENFKTGTMQRLGLSYDVLSKIHPGLIYVSVSGFGNLRPSPYREWGAYAPIAEAMAGFYESRREPDEKPRVGPAGALGDIGSSLFATIGILAALRHRDRTGRGQYVDVAMYDAMVAMADVIPFFWSMGLRSRGTKGRRAGVVDVFQARDGWFILQCVRPHQLEKLAHAVGHPEWLSDERLETGFGWTEHCEDLIRPGIEGWAKDKTMLEACMELNTQGVACGPCNGPEHVINDVHVRDHNMLIEVPRPDSDQDLLVVGNPIKFSESAEGPTHRWPTLGQDTDDVLRTDAGLSDDELKALRDQGVIR